MRGYVESCTKEESEDMEVVGEISSCARNGKGGGLSARAVCLLFFFLLILCRTKSVVSPVNGHWSLVRDAVLP